MSLLRRWALTLLGALVVLEVFFVGRVALMAMVAPQSTAFQRSEAARLASQGQWGRWRQQWVPSGRISDHLKRAVIASEDDGFASHDGVDWGAIEKAWQRNSRASAQVEQANARASASGRPGRVPKVYGGSTITQQLAKNLLLSGERTLPRKAQELVLTFALEALLSKSRILEIYLNSVEWGEGVFGAEAAAQRYFRKPAQALSAAEAARLAVMLPRPKYFEKLPNSAYVSARADVIVRRMGAVVLP